VEALALILLIAGLSTYLQVSSLLTAMMAGFLIVNLSRHHTRSFREIEHIEWPFLIFFFVLSGASVDLGYMGTAAWLTLAYILLRVGGRYLGAIWVRALNHSRQELPSDLGLALTPQAGVAMGMALLAAERFPDQGSLIVATVVTSTIVFRGVRADAGKPGGAGALRTAPAQVGISAAAPEQRGRCLPRRQGSGR